MQQGGGVLAPLNPSSHVSRWLQTQTAPWQGTREQMPLHWGASGHQIGNITDDVPIQLQATNRCITESVFVRMIGCVLESVCVHVCVRYVCAGMRVSAPRVKGEGG